MGVDNGVRAGLRTVTNDGQLVTAFDNIAALHGGVDQARVEWTNGEFDLITDVAIFDSERVAKGASVLCCSLSVLASYLEVVGNILVCEGVFALEGDLLGNLDADIDSVNLDLSAVRTAENLGQHQVVDATVSHERLGQLISGKDSVTVDIEFTVNTCMIVHSGRQLDEAISVIAAGNLGSN